MRVARVLVLGVVVAAMAALAGIAVPGSAGSANGSGRSVTVTGSASVTTVPNRASFSFGVTTQGKTASGALSENATETRKVIEALKAAGIAAADIQTASVSLSPRYSNDGESILGYTATNVVSATEKDINHAGAIVDAAVGAGANEVGGPSLTRSDTSALYRAALRAAVADARKKASAIATASGAHLGAVRSVAEGSSAPAPEPFNAKAAAGASDATPVQPGTQEIDASVTVVFGLG
jgi:uncharacterized protein YggE